MERKHRALFAAGGFAIAILTQVPVGLAAAARDTTMNMGADPPAPTWAPWIMIGFALLGIAAIRLLFLYIHRPKRSIHGRGASRRLPADWPQL